MPIKSCTLPNGESGYKYGDSGKRYASRTDAEKQAAAVHASGYVGDRSIDPDGRMRVEVSNITKAMVCPYYGREIPDPTLEPDRIYYLLRDPAELEKAASSFNNLPLVIEHKPLNADDHDRDIVVGSVGSDVVWDAPYLKASLMVWDAEGIAGIESKEQTELSSAYRYRADMTPGVYEDVPYDGVMRDIIGNHVALVDVGRAGHDVIVGDKLPKGLEMKRKYKLTPKALSLMGAIKASVAPKLAADSALKLAPILHGVDNFLTVKAKLVKHIQPKLAADANLNAEQLDNIIDALIGVEDEELPDVAQDEDDEYEDDPDNPGERRKKVVAQDEDDDKKDKPAMDTKLIEANAVKRVTALFQARADVEPLVGAVAMDSAEEVYKFALDSAKIDISDVHPSAYKSMVAMLKNQPSAKPVIAQDRAAVIDATARFNLNRFKQSL